MAEEALARPVTPPRKRVQTAIEMHEWHTEYLTLRKAMVQGAVLYLQAKQIPFFKEDVFRHFGVSHTSGHNMLKPEATPRRLDTVA
jgi:hypothetical protein